MIQIFTCLLKKELRTFFCTPLAYAVLCFFWFILGLNFYWLLQQISDGERLITALQLLFNSPLIIFSLPVVVPLVTMKLVAEERRLGTLESVLTTTVTDSQFILTKFLSALIFYLILWTPVTIYCVILQKICNLQGVDFFNFGVLIGSFLGIFFIGIFYNAVGVFMSTLTKNQVIAAISGFSIIFSSLFVFMVLTYSTRYEDLRNIAQFFSTFSHMLDFSRGLIDSRYIIFYTFSSIWLLYSSISILQWKRK